MSLLDKLFNSQTTAVALACDDGENSVTVGAADAPVPGQVLTAITNGEDGKPRANWQNATDPTTAAIAAAAAAAASAAQSTANAAGVLAAAAVPKSLYDANSIVIATANDTPIVLPVAASRLLGRGASGDIHDLTAAEASTVLGISAGGAKSLVLPPTSPHADDEEFEGGPGLPAGWVVRGNIDGTNTTITPSTGTDVYANPANAAVKIDVHTRRGSFLHLQHGRTATNNSMPTVACKKPGVAVPTNCFLWGRLGSMHRNQGGTDGGERWGICLAAEEAGPFPDAKNLITLGWVRNSSGLGIGGYSLAAGAETTRGIMYFESSPGPAWEYVGIHKRGTTYSMWAFGDGGGKLHLQTFTLATAMVWQGVFSSCGLPSDPALAVKAADFVRRIDGVTAFPF